MGSRSFVYLPAIRTFSRTRNYGPALISKIVSRSSWTVCSAVPASFGSFSKGSYWVNTSRDTRLDTILDTIPDTKSGPEPKGVSITDQTENLTELNKGVLTKVELKPDSFEDEDPKPVPRSLTEGSVRGRSLQYSTSTGSARTRIRISLLCSCSLRTDRPGFFSQ